MERRHFLKVAIGIVAGATALAANVNAAPLSPISPVGGLIDQKHERLGEGIEPAVVSQDEVDHLKPEEVRWGHRWRWHRRHWGWHRHHHWGWRRHWHRHHHWHRRFW